MTYFQELLAVFQRGLIVLWRNKLLLIGNMILPIAVIIVIGPAADAQTVGLEYEDLATGIMCMMIFFSGMFIPNNIIWDRESGYLNMMFVSPCHRSTIVLGYSLVGAVRSTLQVTTIYIGASLIGISLGHVNLRLGVDILILLILLTILMTVFVGGFMTIIASFSKNSETFFLLSGMIVMPLIFLSNVFFNPASLPFGIGAFGAVNPLNYLVNLVRFITIGTVPPEGPFLGIIILALGAIGFTLLGTFSFVRTVKK